MKIVMLDRNSVGMDMDVSIFESLGEFEAHDVADRESCKKWIQDANVIIFNKSRMDEDMLKDALEVQLLCVTATGFDNIDIVSAKKRLCYEITKFVRGEEDAILAQNMSENLFTDGGNDAPEFEINSAAIENGISILDLLVQTNLCSSKGEARKMIANGGITAKGEKVTDPNLVITSVDLDDEKSILLKKGKKTFIKVVVR